MLSELGRLEAQKGVESDRGKDPGIHLKLLVSRPPNPWQKFYPGSNDVDVRMMLQSNPHQN